MSVIIAQNIMYKLVGTCSLCLVKSPVTRRLPCRFLCSETSNAGDLLQAYDPKEVEKQHFTNAKYFEPPLASDKPYTLILPPPNITGTLHLGHALTTTIEDVLVRWKRMQGVETLWIPGIDHAGIATQVVVEKSLWQEEHKTRHEIGREEFQKKVLQWKEEKMPVIRQQLRRLGASLDWNWESFTMDQRHSRAVQAAFVKLFESGLIYRSDYLVNWSCDLRSAISDIEVEHLEVNGPTNIHVPGYDKPVKFGVLYKFAYKLKDSEEEIIVATTRPETVLGDVAVAVHPQDSRFQRFIGRDLWHPFRKETIPVIADDFVDPQFGTGAVKVTPGHDRADFAAARRHSLGALQVIDETGRLSSPFPEFRGVRRFDARGRIVDALTGMGLMRGEEGHRNVIPICSRSKDVVELMVRPQWFIRCEEMAKRALEAVRNGKLSIHPRDFENQWFTWLENIRDWCISRQLWWGHQIPAYLCKVEGEEVWVAAEDENIAREKAANKLGVPVNSISVTRDDDVLDTWFSSGLQAFAVLGWPEKTADFEKYFPLSLMETGHDILFFWVARMVMLGVQLTGRLPFEKVLLHGIICDSQGRKMSKSLGNVVAPEHVINGITLSSLEEGLHTNFATGVLSKDELKRAINGQKKMFPEGIPECGSDALRFTLVSHNIKSHFINFDVKECHTNRLFCNKIWQATRFAKMNLSKCDKWKEVHVDNLKLMDKWILSRLTRTVSVVNASLESYDFHVATLALKNFLYYDYCDVYLESTKPGLRNTGSVEAAGHCWTLLTCLDVGLRSLAPFMPMVAQHLHQRLPIEDIRVDFPKDLPWLNVALEKDVEKTMEIVVSIRRLKKTFHINNKQKTDIHLVGPAALLDRFFDVIHNLAVCQAMENPLNLTHCVKDVVGDVSVFLPVSDEQRKALELDMGKMAEREDKLSKELEKLRLKISAESYKVNTKTETREGHLKKIASIEDKLSRIDYIRNLMRT